MLAFGTVTDVRMNRQARVHLPGILKVWSYRCDQGQQDQNERTKLEDGVEKLSHSRARKRKIELQSQNSRESTA